MAVDRKADHVGNHGGRYTDIDGHSRQFTTIDHDKKTKISTNTGGVIPSMDTYRADLIKRITDLPASIAPPVFLDFTLRGDREKVEWNTDMLLDAGVPLNVLRDICNLTENIAEAMRLI